MRGAVSKTVVVLEMIKFQHTIFALPFALTSLMLAAASTPGHFSLKLLFWIIAACVSARTCAMCFNRWADAEIDARNPRTASRAIPAGLLPRKVVLGWAIAAGIIFVLCAWFINPLAFALSPVALCVLIGYSYAKRFTSGAHFVLGLALALAPIGAWVGLTGKIGGPSLLLGAFVLLWTAGFDIIYACQDYTIDLQEGLHSIPARLGIARALIVSALLHVMCVAILLLVPVTVQLGLPFYTGAVAVAVLLTWEHVIVKPGDLSRLNAAFFTVNSWVGVILFAFTATDLAIRSWR